MAKILPEDFRKYTLELMGEPPNIIRHVLQFSHSYRFRIHEFRTFSDVLYIAIYTNRKGHRP